LPDQHQLFVKELLSRNWNNRSCYFLLIAKWQLNWHLPIMQAWCLLLEY